MTRESHHRAWCYDCEFRDQGPPSVWDDAEGHFRKTGHRVSCVKTVNYDWPNERAKHGDYELFVKAAP